MFEVNNKFDIGEKAFTVYRVPVQYKCPICEGQGRFKYNGYDVHCKNCNGTGYIHNKQFCVLEVCEVVIKYLRVSIHKDRIDIRYKVEGTNANHRSERMLFKTREEAELYCEQVNKKEIAGDF